MNNFGYIINLFKYSIIKISNIYSISFLFKFISSYIELMKDAYFCPSNFNIFC